MRVLKRLVAVAVSTAILFAIFSQIELEKFGRYFSDMDWGWFGASMVVFIPVFFIHAVRLRYLMGGKLSISNSLKIVLAGSSLNMILPSKGGQLAKGFFMQRHTGMDLKTCFSAVILERVVDVTALVLLLFAGLYILGDGSRSSVGLTAR